MQTQQTPAELDHVLHPERRRANRSAPIFVLGSVRSGTSAMGYALTRGAGIPGHDEGHVSTLLQAMLNAADLVASNFPESGGRYLLDQFDTPALRTHVINYFQAFFEQRYPDGRWCDKSPSDFEGAPAVRVAPLLLEMFPNARFIYCQRRGIENVLSRVTKFPQTPFWYHCRSWATTILAWHEVRAQLGDRWIEVRQEQMALEPEKVSDQLAAFLGLSAEQRDGVLRTFLKDRPEQSRPADEGHELSMKEAGWDSQMQGMFLSECATAMALAGYSIDGSPPSAEHGLRLFWSTSAGAQGSSLKGLPREAHFARSRDEFTLGPSLESTRGVLRYHDFRLAGRRHFRSRVLLEGPADLDVEFGIEIHNGVGQRILHAKTTARSQQGPVALECSLPAGDLGVCSVSLYTEVVRGRPDATHAAVWRTPAFYV
ncbi:MAG: sulfotransferase [Planctomycetes bacterium]|nr:sulfotransferase [Planctomycetota bacterium]